MDFLTQKKPQKKPLLIMGIGNMLMGDEGLGVHFVKKLNASTNSPAAEIIDGGTGGFHLMPYFEAYDKVILIDATLGDEAPGTIRLLKPQFSKDFPKAMSTHDIGLKDLVESMLLLNILPKIYLFTVSIEEIQEMQVGLTPQIEACLDILQEKVLALAFRLLNEDLDPGLSIQPMERIGE